MKRFTRALAAGLFSASILAGCGSIVWFAVVRNSSIDLPDGKSVTIGDALDSYKFCRPNSGRWSYTSVNGVQNVAFSCRYEGEAGVTDTLGIKPRITLSVNFEIPEWSVKYRLSRLWYTVDLAGGRAKAGIFEVDADDPEAVLRDIAQGREAAISIKGFGDLVEKAMKSLGLDISPLLERLGRGSGDKDEGWTKF